MTDVGIAVDLNFHLCPILLAFTLGRLLGIEHPHSLIFQITRHTEPLLCHLGKQMAFLCKRLFKVVGSLSNALPNFLIVTVKVGTFNQRTEQLIHFFYKIRCRFVYAFSQKSIVGIIGSLSHKRSILTIEGSRHSSNLLRQALGRLLILLQQQRIHLI